MPLRILHAADAGSVADELATALHRERKRDATILLVSDGLDSATNKNDILRDALAAANDGTLVVVRIGDASAPIGTRDSPSVDWPTSGVTKTVRDIVAKALPKSK